MSDPKSNDFDDVEITPEMIETGILELWASGIAEHPDWDWDGDGLVIKEIYLVMERARLAGRRAV